MEWSIPCQGCGTIFKSYSRSDPEDAINAWYVHSMSCPALAEKREKEKVSKFVQFFTMIFNVIRKPFDIALTWTETKVWTLVFHIDKGLDRMRKSTNQFIENVHAKFRR